MMNSAYQSSAELLLKEANDYGSSKAINLFVNSMGNDVRIVRKTSKQAGSFPSFVIHFKDDSFLQFWTSEPRFKRGFITAFLTRNIIVGNEDVIRGTALES